MLVQPALNSSRWQQVASILNIGMHSTDALPPPLPSHTMAQPLLAAGLVFNVECVIMQPQPVA